MGPRKRGSEGARGRGSEGARERGSEGQRKREEETQSVIGLNSSFSESVVESEEEVKRDFC